MNPLLSVSHLCKSFDGVRALDGFSCDAHEGEILGLVGPNGAGKTTLFHVLTGLLQADAGTACFRDLELTALPTHRIATSGIARTFQECRLVGGMSVIQNVLLAFRDQPGERLLNVFFRPRHCRDHEGRIRARAEEYLAAAGLEDRADDMADDLSYGQQKLLTLIACLAADATLLLLDEPVAGIAPEMKAQMLGIIKGLPRFGKTVILIEHDIEAITEICNRVVFMQTGRAICEGTPFEIRNDPRVIEAYLE